MKNNKLKILYISNIEVPYRTKFFNLFSQHCELTVFYERQKSLTRDTKWTQSQQALYKKECFKGINIGNENAFSFKMIKKAFGDYDKIIIGCYNSPVQMLLILLLRLFKKPYILNLDGEVFADDNSIKSKIKRFFLKGADKYLTAGEKTAEFLKKIINSKEIFPYYFSSLSQEQLEANAKEECNRTNTILVVGQYEYYKGLDIAIQAAKLNPDIQYKFVGMGAKTEQFVLENKADELQNVEIIPFLQSEELYEEYKTCAMFVLPSRQECWGLVINEAASFGTPIVSTWGSGAAVEFIADEYSQFLAKPCDSKDLYDCICRVFDTKNIEQYSTWLKQKSSRYSIEASVDAHIKACCIKTEE